MGLITLISTRISIFSASLFKPVKSINKIADQQSNLNTMVDVSEKLSSVTVSL